MTVRIQALAGSLTEASGFVFIVQIFPAAAQKGAPKNVTSEVSSAL